MGTPEDSKQDSFSETLLSFMQRDISRITCTDEIQTNTVLESLNAKVLASDTREERGGVIMTTRSTTKPEIFIEETKQRDGSKFINRQWFIYRTNIEDDH